MKGSTSFIVLSKKKLRSVDLDLRSDVILFIHEQENEPEYETLHFDNIEEIRILIKSIGITDLAFISKDDKFEGEVLKKYLAELFEANKHKNISLLVPYKVPPQFAHRPDGTVQTFLVSTKSTVVKFLDYFAEFYQITYILLYKYLNSSTSNNINIYQVGGPERFGDCPEQKERESLKKSLLIIPHKGSVKLLKRCLYHLNQVKLLPRIVNLCFDDLNYKRLDIAQFKKLKDRLDIYLNNPLRVGPYLPRHHSIISSKKEYIFFQDSDDISIKNRFWLQIRELEDRNLDMVGSHELRIDEIEKKVLIVRFPINVTKALASGSFHPLFHPTSLITRRAYLKSKGFSTDRKFGYDSQFLLRSHFYLKIGNIDEFLYIRFRRHNSLTTNVNTRIGSSLRSFLVWRWVTDFKLIQENKLRLTESSLSVQKHKCDYKLTRL